MQEFSPEIGDARGQLLIGFQRVIQGLIPPADRRAYAQAQILLETLKACSDDARSVSMGPMKESEGTWTVFAYTVGSSVGSIRSMINLTRNSFPIDGPVYIMLDSFISGKNDRVSPLDLIAQWLEVEVDQSVIAIRIVCTTLERWEKLLSRAIVLEKEVEPKDVTPK